MSAQSGAVLGAATTVGSVAGVKVLAETGVNPITVVISSIVGILIIVSAVLLITLSRKNK